MSRGGCNSYLPLSSVEKEEVRSGGKKRRKSDVENVEPCCEGARPQNAKELFNWLQLVEHYDGLDMGAPDLPQYSSLEMLLDPDFAFDWTPACSKEFKSLIVASGVSFEEDRDDCRSSKGNGKSAIREDCLVGKANSTGPSSSPTNSAQEIVDITANEGEVLLRC